MPITKGDDGSGWLGRLHHKLMTIDDHQSIFGSINDTQPPNESNDEDIVVGGDLDETKASARSKLEQGHRPAALNSTGFGRNPDSSKTNRENSQYGRVA